MSNLFHLALHIQQSDNIVGKMEKFYADLLGGNAVGTNHDDHVFARCGNTILAFEPREAQMPKTLSFFATPIEMIESIKKKFESQPGFQKDKKGNISLKDPAGNTLTFKSQRPDAPARPMGMRVELDATDLAKTKTFYESHFDCKVKESDDVLKVNFFEHKLIFSKKEGKVSNGFSLDEKIIQQAKESQLLVAEHFGVTDLTKERITEIIEGFEEGKACLLAPMIANENTEHEEIYTFVEDPNGYAVELRFLKNPNVSLKEVEKIAQQNENVVKREYHVSRRNNI